MQIGIRELRSGLAGFVRRAAAGESFVLTVSGRPVAQLGPLGGSTQPSLDEMVAQGAVVAPRTRTAPGTVERVQLPVDARPSVELHRIR